jgi:integrase
MYLANGLNCGDMCRLKYSNLKNDSIEFIREKTKRTKRDLKPIEISYTEDLKRIVEKFGNTNKNGYIFPVIETGLTPERERQLILQIIGVINDHMKKIANDLGIISPVTTMSCRHSFSTILQQNNVPISFISEALGHTSLITTQNYLKGFTSETKKDVARLLTSFSK